MLVFRIAGNDYVNDLSGYGAKLNGGRWNREGVPILYTGSSIALCAWEYWVHLPKSIALKQNAFAVATIQLPASLIYCPDIDLVPGQWKGQADLLLAISDNWIARNEYVVMKVPSAIIEQEWNYLVNPLYPLFSEVRLLSVNPFSFDKRAFGKQLLT